MTYNYKKYKSSCFYEASAKGKAFRSGIYKDCSKLNSKKTNSQLNMGKIFELKLYRRRYKNGNNHIKRCKLSLVFMEMQVTITMRYHQLKWLKNKKKETVD